MSNPTKPRKGNSAASRRGKKAWFSRRVKEGMRRRKRRKR